MFPLGERRLVRVWIIDPVVPAVLLRRSHGVTVRTHHVTLGDLRKKRLYRSWPLPKSGDSFVLLAGVTVIKLKSWKS